MATVRNIRFSGKKDSKDKTVARVNASTSKPSATTKKVVKKSSCKCGK